MYLTWFIFLQPGIVPENQVHVVNASSLLITISCTLPVHGSNQRVQHEQAPNTWPNSATVQACTRTKERRGWARDWGLGGVSLGDFWRGMQFSCNSINQSYRQNVWKAGGLFWHMGSSRGFARVGLNLCDIDWKCNSINQMALSGLYTMFSGTWSIDYCPIPDRLKAMTCVTESDSLMISNSNYDKSFIVIHSHSSVNTTM